MNYVKKYKLDLRRQLDAADISNAQLARELGEKPSQIARLFNTDECPRLKRVAAIDTAIANILARRDKELAKYGL